MGHADLIDVGKTHDKTDLHFVFILYDRVHFISNITGRFLYLHQYFIS